MGQIECVTRYDLVKTEGGGWQLNSAGKAVAWRENKCALLDDLQATLDRVGDGDGTVRIHTETGGIEEERTYPRSG
jgi:hypothetical protein